VIRSLAGSQLTKFRQLRTSKHAASADKGSYLASDAPNVNSTHLGYSTLSGDHKYTSLKPGKLIVLVKNENEFLVYFTLNSERSRCFHPLRRCSRHLTPLEGCAHSR